MFFILISKNMTALRILQDATDFVRVNRKNGQIQEGDD